MRIGVFTYGMDGQRMTGIARYAMELTRALRALQPELEIILINPYPNSEHPWYEEFQSYPVPSLARLPAVMTLGNWILHRAALDLELDVLHDPCGVAPFLLPTSAYARVTTVHDAIPLVYPESQPWLTRVVFQTLIRAAPHTVDAVLTVSRSAADDLQRLVGLPADLVHVTPNGVTWPVTSSSDAAKSAAEALGLRSPYLLCVGALHPRKNLRRILDAVADVRASGVDVQLAVVGPPSWGAASTHATVAERAHAEAGVVATGFVSDATLHALYEGASALVFPSLYEGFGLPVLEAMVRGTPVITSNVSALPEVVGDAGILVDPTSTKAIAEAMRRIVLDTDLAAEMRRRGYERARSFTWRRTAEGTLRVYEQLVRERSARSIRRPSSRAR